MLMKRQMLKILMALCLALCLAPAALAEPTTVVKIDVGGGNVDTTDYSIEDRGIILNTRAAVMYELTGETDKPILIWGRNSSSDPGAYDPFYIRAKNVKVNGGITVYNCGIKLVLDVPSGTDNTIATIIASDLTIKGSGTLRAQTLNTTQYGASNYIPSALNITDTNIIVNVPSKRSGEWNGPCVLSGSATVTYIGGISGDYVPLKIGVANGDSTHSLTLKDSAKLYCLPNPEAPATTAYSVDGLDFFNGASLLLQDNSYLEAEARPTTGSYMGYGILVPGSLCVKDNAKLKGTAQGIAVCAGSVDISGGEVTADSTANVGIYSYSPGSIKISNQAKVKATGGSNWQALYGVDDVSISSSFVEASSVSGRAIYSKKNVSIENSVVKTKTGSTNASIRSLGKTSISGSWLETSGNESYDGSIQNSVLFNGDAGKVIGDAQLPADAEIAKGRTLLISAGTSLSIGSGKTLVNNGLVTVEGSFSKAGGTLICNSHSGGAADCKSAAACSLCGTRYGAPNAGNHTDLKHVEAKAATNSEDGNIEYWYCSACGKYYSDAQAAHEIAKEETVIAKLVKVSDQEIKNLPKTGDDSRVMLWLALLAVSGGLLAQILVNRKKNVKP